MTPEAKARIDIDKLLAQAGWHVCGMGDFNIHVAQGVAIREFPLNSGFGFADYLLYVNGKACGVIEAKKAGSTLSGVEVQSGRYAQGLPASLPAWHRPLPFLFESTGVETHFTNGLDPQPRARGIFAFFRPELLAGWLAYLPGATGQPAANDEARTFLHRMRNMPQLVTEWGAGGAAYQLWPAQITALENLEKSLAANKPKALIQMATGSGKTFTSISFIYRLIKFAGARRVLFLVDRGNLARQTKKEFDQYASPYNNFKFGEEYIVQHLQSNQLDTNARVVICTIQRMFSMLKGREFPPEADEESTEGLENLFKEPEPIGYNARIPIESFDIVVTDEAHRSIYNLWRQVLEYFDAYLIGLTATPNKQTFGFFNQNLVMEYGHAQAVADGVNVNYDVFRIKTEVTEAGAKVEKGYWLETLDKATRRKTAWQLDEDFEYDPAKLDRAVRIFVADGDPGGLRLVERSNWVGKALMFPRASLPQVKQRSELSQTGVYLLLGPREDGEGDMLYVGEGDPSRPRLESYYAQKDFWTRAVCFVAAPGQLNKARVQFLESNPLRLAKAAKRVPLDNGNHPAEPSLSEADRADMLVFLDNMLGMLPVMGVDAFEQPAKASVSPAPVLTCKGKGVVATGYEASQGFVVKAGSQAVAEAVPSMLQHVRSMFDIRQELIGNGVLVRDSVAFRFSQDYAFSAPSTAAAVVLGRSANGRIEWKDANGRTLKELQAMEAGA